MGKRISGIIVAVSLLAAACGLGDKQARADRIIDSVELAFERGSANGTLSLTAEVVSLPALAGGVPEPDPAVGGGFEQPMIVVNVVMDLPGRRASNSFGTSDTPFVVFDGLDIYGYRYNASERDARPWVFVEAEGLQEGSGALDSPDAFPVVGAFAVNPVVFVDLIAAPLTGSIEEVGPESVAGVQTIRYDANFDLEKMLRDTREDEYPESTRETLETILDLIVVRGNTHPGSVWLDAEGLPRRFQVKLRQQPVTDVKFDLIVTLELTDFGSATVTAPPGPGALVKVGSLLQYLGVSVPSPDSVEFAELVLGLTV